MTAMINLTRLEGVTRLGRGWGDDGCPPCIMRVLSGKTNTKSAAKKTGLPIWLTELAEWINYCWPAADRLREMTRFAVAAAVAQRAGVDLSEDGPVWRDVRLNAILPIAMEAIGTGNESWRGDCRAMVQWSLDNGGKRADAVEVARAARAARVTRTSEAVRVSWATRAAEAAEAAGATLAADAAGAAGAHAHRRIHEAVIEALTRAAGGV